MSINEYEQINLVSPKMFVSAFREMTFIKYKMWMKWSGIGTWHFHRLVHKNWYDYYEYDYCLSKKGNLFKCLKSVPCNC